MPVTLLYSAINAAAHGDRIELTDGVFTGEGNRDLSYDGKQITIASESSDPWACIIDCEAGPEDTH